MVKVFEEVKKGSYKRKTVQVKKELADENITVIDGMPAQQGIQNGQEMHFSCLNMCIIKNCLLGMERLKL